MNKKLSNFIHVWIIQLDIPLASIEASQKILSIDEKVRINRFRYENHKQRYTAAHAGLRKVLSKYIPLKPEDITFETNAFGKPALGKEHMHDEVQFNLSHSGELALVAVVKGRSVGIDVEWIKPLSDHLKIAERHFTSDEVGALNQMNRSSSAKSFIQLWAGKESLIKARGSGLSIPLNQFNLVGLIASPDYHVCTVVDPADNRTWSVSPLNLKSGYLGAVTVEGKMAVVEYFKL
jgi:4'-phosphopantetheinyl transferase